MIVKHISVLTFGSFQCKFIGMIICVEDLVHGQIDDTLNRLCLLQNISIHLLYL